MSRIGVFVCWCGHNIARTVDIEKLIDAAGFYPDVVYSVEYKYMCSDPGQKLVHEAVKNQELDGVVIAACSPRLHESTFRNTCTAAGLNPYRCEIANIREHCSWVHKDRDKATAKAADIIASLVEKIRLNEPLIPIEVPVIKKALVIGGGISGIEAALSIAGSGHDVVLVERESVLGGNMLRLASTYHIKDGSACLLSSKIVDAFSHPKIKVLTHSEIDEFSGYIGNFEVKIRQKADFIDTNRCNGCGDCLSVCPVHVSEIEDTLFGPRAAIHFPDVPSLPAVAVIDNMSCTHSSDGCSRCADACREKAIDFKQTDQFVEEEFGAVIIATGFRPFPKTGVKDIDVHGLPDMIDGFAFERILAEQERTGDLIKRPSDGKAVESIVFVQCAGSRDKDKGVPYCSRICCMTTAKQAKFFKEITPQGEAYIFYSHIRAGGKGFEEYVQDSITDNQIIYLRGDVSRFFSENGAMKVWGRDELSGHEIEIDADLVVLTTPLIPNRGSDDLAKKLKVATDENGFFAEIHPKLRPVESASLGVYLAGCAQSPRDIPESITHALGASGKVIALFSAEFIYQEPIIVRVDEDFCSGCGVCVTSCPYDSRRINPWTQKAEVIAALCQGCGACAVACPNGATQQQNFTKNQIMNMIDAVLKD
ncbi:MAG: CoB--CoM heterodisulfide reductase iron-sulfur subunit A family protein [Acidobacteria bacterium]|nr:CoB--CoM heterodisulfide reductase iron-sulfur subunit A family protein [Acidobacteriota bacterium]